MDRITSRDWFAGMALKALIEQGMHIDHSDSTIATIAHRLADAMMEKREQHAMPKQTPVMPSSIRGGLGS